VVLDAAEAFLGDEALVEEIEETRWRIETLPGRGRRIWKRSAARLRYFGRRLFSAAFAIGVLSL